jgi:hypothetical protein
MLAMLVAGVLLLALAGSGIAGGSGTSRSSDDSAAPSGAPAAGQSQSGQGMTHRGRHCHHDQQAPQQSPTEAPPV